ncbi:MAG: hypothetical protein ACR2PS_06860 [Pseudomonadales bacterium]
MASTAAGERFSAFPAAELAPSASLESIAADDGSGALLQASKEQSKTKLAHRKKNPFIVL